jgi:hypothetical protein
MEYILYNAFLFEIYFYKNQIWNIFIPNVLLFFYLTNFLEKKSLLSDKKEAKNMAS